MMTIVSYRDLQCTFAPLIALCTGCVGPTETKPCNLNNAMMHPVADGVTYYDCSETDTKVHVVTIDRNRRDSEIWLLDDRVSPDLAPVGTLALQTLSELASRYNAVVAVNGYNFREGDAGSLPGTGVPTTTTYETGFRLTSNTSRCTGVTEGVCLQALLGFAAAPDEPGEAPIAHRTAIEPRHIPARKPTDSEPHPDPDPPPLPADAPYYYNLYGSNTSVVLDGECTEDATGESNWSIVGYSPHKVIFLTTDTPYKVSELCPVLQQVFEVTHAVQQDGGSAAEMVIRGFVTKEVNPAGPSTGLFDLPDPGNIERAVAYGVGLVDLYAVNLQNAGFEQPVLSSDEVVRHITDDSSDTPLPGWRGSVDLLQAAGPGHGTQLVGLSDRSTCGGFASPGENNYIETPLRVPPKTYCVLRFFHGVDEVDSTTFDLNIDGVNVQHFTSTLDPNGLKAEVVRFQTRDKSPALLRFQSTTPRCLGATIDDVIVSCTKI